MSFMFKPLPYDDWSAINHLQLDQSTIDSLIDGFLPVVHHIGLEITKIANNLNKGVVVVIDGYISAKMEDLAHAVAHQVAHNFSAYEVLAMSDCYKSKEEIDEITNTSLPSNFEEDPVLMFGKLFSGKIEDLIDQKKLNSMLKKLASIKSNDLMIIYGLGCSIKAIRQFADKVIYIDVIPKNTAIRARSGSVINIGDHFPRPFNELMRRNYYVDFELVLAMRKELLTHNLIDYYISDATPNSFMLLPRKSLVSIFKLLVQQPFRCKPVYLEGIWGGEYIRKVRQLPLDIAQNIAWIFEMIPMEVSIVIDFQNKVFEIPFFSFIQHSGKELMGSKCFKEFDGYFPIRFNYDDTYHSDGNMSIQVHPDEEFASKKYNEIGRQDEAYYIIATGHNAKTFVGFNQGVNPQEFIDLAKKSECDGSVIDYAKYINSIPSVPGKQIMIPAGTIHASGRNQFILELGSLTIGSYTYKVYDYNRRDNSGNLRPIHSHNAEQVVIKERNAIWVEQNIAIPPRIINHQTGCVESVVGSTELMYYETSRIDIDTGKKYQGKNLNQFTVVTVVDGEKVRIYSLSNPEFNYAANYLDIIIIPATIEDYIIENIGYQPVAMHKTYLKDNYSRYKNNQGVK